MVVVIGKANYHHHAVEIQIIRLEQSRLMLFISGKIDMKLLYKIIGC
jgi:hypothetical protein